MLAPLHLTRLVAVFVLVGWLARRRRDGFDLWIKSPENVALLGLFAAAVASVPSAYWKMTAFDTALDLGRMVVVFVLIANLVNTPKRLMGFMTAFVLLNVFVSAEQLFHYVTSSPGPNGLLRVGGAGSFLGEDGDFALAINVALPFIYYLAWSKIKPAFRWLCAAAAMMLVCSIMATGSRGGVVGLCSVLLVITLRSRKRLATALVITGVIATAWLFAPPAYKMRVVSIGAPIEQDLTAQTRLTSWKAARQMFIEHPVVGVGAGNFLTAFVGRYGGGYNWSTTAHNVFYQTAAELGLCGLLPFLALIACALIRGARLNGRLVRAGLGDTPMAAYAAALFPSTVAFVVSGSFQTPLYYPHIYLIAALGVALNNTARSLLEHYGQEEVRSRWRPVRTRRLTRSSR